MGQEVGTCDSCGAKGVECIGWYSAGGVKSLCKNCYSARHKGNK